MRTRRKPIKVIDEAIEELLDQAVDSISGVIAVPVPPGKAHYLKNQIISFIRATAVESFEIYQPGEPLYGKGLYSHITLLIKDGQLYLIDKRDEPPRDPVLLICAAAATKTPITITTPSEDHAIRFAARVINARRSLWRAANRVVPDTRVLELLDSVTVSHHRNQVSIGIQGENYLSSAKEVVADDAIEVLAALAASESLSAQLLDMDDETG